MHKVLKIVPLIIFTALGCAPTKYYQVYEVESDSSLEKNGSTWYFEDDNCKVTFEFWAPNGKVDCLIYNKSEQNLYVNKKESFLVLNGIAHDYYEGQTLTTSDFNALVMPEMLGLKNEITKTKGFSVSIAEKDIIIIPPKSGKYLNSFSIAYYVYDDCDLNKYPRSRDTSSASFSIENTPYSFDNIINYTLESDTNSKQVVRNKFFVSRIINYPSRLAKEYQNEVICGEKTYNEIQVFIPQASNKFYIPYFK